MADEVTVPVQSTWWSKINWAQVVGVIASALVIFTGGKVDLSAELQAYIVVAIQAIIGALTIVLKTYFNSTVTPQSARRG